MVFTDIYEATTLAESQTVKTMPQLHLISALQSVTRIPLFLPSGILEGKPGVSGTWVKG